MLVKPMKYKRFVTLHDIYKLLKDLDYNPEEIDHNFIIDGDWEFEKTLYSDNMPWKIAEHISGVGVFKNWNDELPSIVINHNLQTVFIFDKDLIDYVNTIFFDENKTISVRITFEKAFSSDFNFKQDVAIGKSYIDRQKG